MKRWILASGKITPKKGGNYTFAWDGGYRHSGKVLDYDRDKRLSLLWPHYSGENLLGNTRVTFRLKPKEEGTLLEMTHAVSSLELLGENSMTALTRAGLTISQTSSPSSSTIEISDRH